MSKLESKFRALRLYLLSCFFRHPLSIGTIFVTRRCNRKCSYCFSSTNEAKNELGLQELQMVIDRFRECGVWSLGLYGGEPSLRSDLADIIRYAHSKGMFTIVYTNGSFKNISVGEVVNAGVDIVDIAIDSISNSNFKNYDEARETLERLTGEYNVGVKLNLCIVRGNCGETADILGLAERLRVPISIHLGARPILGTNIPYDANIFFEKGNTSDMKQVERISKFLANKARKSILLMHPPEYFEVWPRFMRGEEWGWKCKAGETSLCVDSNGTILQCVGATFPVKIKDRALHYRDINRINVGFVKQEIKRLIQKCNCNPRCVSCVYMFEYYLRRNPSRFLRVVLSF